MREIEGFNFHPEGLSEKQEKFCSQLFEIRAIKFGNFKLKLHEKHPEAPLSPIYIDMRIIRRYPEVKKTAVDVYEKLVSPLKFDLIADIPTSITPIVSSISDRLGVGMITPRTDSKTHGTGAKIDGFQESDKGKTVVIFDDLITSGASIEEGVNILVPAGLNVKDIALAMDREQGGRERLEKEGLNVRVAFTMTQMLNFYARVERLSDGALQDIKQRLNILNTFIEV